MKDITVEAVFRRRNLTGDEDVLLLPLIDASDRGPFAGIASAAGNNGSWVLAVTTQEHFEHPASQTFLSQCDATLLIADVHWLPAMIAIHALCSHPDDRFDLARFKAVIGSGPVFVISQRTPDGTWTNKYRETERAVDYLAIATAAKLRLAVRGMPIHGVAWVVNTVEPLLPEEQDDVEKILLADIDVVRHVTNSGRFMSNEHYGEASIILMARVEPFDVAPGPNIGVAANKAG